MSSACFRGELLWNACVFYAENTRKKNGYFYSEDIWTKLSKKLQAGKKYELIVSINVADSIFCAQVGYLLAGFSSTEPDYLDWPICHGKKLHVFQIPITKPTPKDQWTQISIEFEASSAAEYFQLGLMRPVFSEKEYKKMASQLSQFGRTPKAVDVLIDDIELFESGEGKIKNIFK